MSVEPSLVSRYPGAHPFADDATSRLVFCGRDVDSAALLNLVLAQRLVVVYGKSGLGKTSLLQAGLAEPLRDENCLPLTARPNVVGRSLLAGVFDAIALDAKRQGIEHHQRPAASLWRYFKTAEFWNGDRLMTPVLILDQFEEIFTLQDERARADFLKDLGFLIRGVRPPGDAGPDQDGRPLSEKPPNVRVIISLREEFLGLLDEAAADIPQILDHRFRLKPLGLDAAAEAIEKPAASTDLRFSTPPFRYAPGTVRAIVSALATRQPTNGSLPRAQGYVEPFQLQLICRRAEEKAADRYAKAGHHTNAQPGTGPTGEAEVAVSFDDDLGGLPGIQKTLRTFYNDIVGSIHPYRTRKTVERLCADYLINPQGRRLSLELGEIQRILNLDADTLKALVNRRLLRADQRADGWYYELSHDSLVQPILSTRRVRSVALGSLGLIASVIEALVALILLAVGFLQLDNFIAVLVAAAVVILALWHAFFGGRRSVDTLTRYWRLTDWTLVVCAYAAFVVIQWVGNLVFGSGFQTSAGILSLEFAQALFLGAAAFALIRSNRIAVPLLGAGLVTTIAVSSLRYSSDLQRYGNPSYVLIANSFAIGFAAVCFGYAWFLRTKRILQ